MKMKSKIINRILSIAIGCYGLLSLNSCSNYLDVDQYIYDVSVFDSVFVNADNLQAYINGIASYLPNEDRLYTSSWSPFQGASDENFPSWNDSRHAAVKLLLNEITPQNANSYYNNYGTWYKGIRKANTVLANMDVTPDVSTSTKRQYTGEMYFFKGYFLYLLLQQYGPVVIPPDDLLDLNSDGESLSMRNNFV